MQLIWHFVIADVKLIIAYDQKKNQLIEVDNTDGEASSNTSHFFDRSSFYLCWRKIFNPSPRSPFTLYHSLPLDFVSHALILILIHYPRPICSPELSPLAHKSFDYGKMTFLSSAVPTIHISVAKKKKGNPERWLALLRSEWFFFSLSSSTD